MVLVAAGVSLGLGADSLGSVGLLKFVFGIYRLIFVLWEPRSQYATLVTGYRKGGGSIDGHNWECCKI